MLTTTARLFACLSIAGSAAMAQAQTASITGNLPRDLNYGQFDLVITISNVPDAAHAKGLNDPVDEAGNVAARLQLFLTDLASTRRLYNSSEQTQAAADPALPFFVVPKQVHTETAQVDGTWTYTYFVTVEEAVRGALAAKLCTAAAGGTPTTNCTDIIAHVAADFFLGGTDGSPVAKVDPPQPLQQMVYVVAETPEFRDPAPVLGGMESLVVRWTPKNEVSVLGNVPSPQQAGNVVIYVVDTSVVHNNTSIPAKKFSGGTKPDADGACTFNLSGPSGVCVTCPADGAYYLDPNVIGGVLGFQNSITVPNRGANVFVVDGLTNGSQYAVFLQYQPDGIIPVSGQQCIVGTPSAN